MEVRLAYMQFTGPTLSDLLEKATAEGHRSFRILPLFMASAGHVDKDIKPLVEELTGRFPEADIELLEPVGENPLFPSLILNIANDTFS
jgi:sirohydrochlorin ferrochelatase